MNSRTKRTHAMLSYTDRQVIGNTVKEHDTYNDTLKQNARRNTLLEIADAINFVNFMNVFDDM